ncbi:MAG: hypothetical protein IK144_03290 [Bacteroidaceae bacterium]|nr:hypothetical protein [Bacteroidaceae bacterium]
MSNESCIIEPLPWLVMYSNSGDIGIQDILDAKKAESDTTGIIDYFIPFDVTRQVVDGNTVEHKRLIAGNYIFLRATKEDILRLRQEPPFDLALRFLHPLSSPTGCIYIPDSEMQMLRLTVQKMDGDAEYFVPSSKQLIAGDYVCVFEGPFAGVKGVLESVKGHEGGRVIVPIGDVLAVRTSRIPAREIQLLDLAKVTDSQAGSYTSRAYKKVRVLIADSEKLLSEKEKTGTLCESSRCEACRLIMRFSQLRLSGKIRLMHAQAIYNLLLALGETDSERFFHFRNMLP